MTTFLAGYDIAPLQIGFDGVVSFGTSKFLPGGVVQVTPNQKQCEAYGYRYDKINGLCMAFDFNPKITSSLNNIENSNNGPLNSNAGNTRVILVNGMSNTTLGLNANCLINGEQNTITRAVRNTGVIGKLAEATTTNSIILGGNGKGDELGERQNITLMFGTETTNSTVTDSYLNNTTGSFFEIPTDTIIVFQTETVGVRIGGTGGGSVGDFKGFIETGVAINKSGTLSIDKSRSTIANTGTTSGWNCDITVSGTNLVQTVKGANNRTVKWATTIRMTQIKTGVAL